jgi:AAA domain
MNDRHTTRPYVPPGSGAPPPGGATGASTPPPGGSGASKKASAKGKPTKFKLVPFEDIHFDPVQEWLIKKLLPRQGLAVLFGLPRTFKSFIAINIALYVALGWDWAGRQVAQGDAVYIAAENAAGIRKRKIGFEQAHENLPPGPVPFYLIEVAPNLGSEKNDLHALVASVEAVSGTPRLIVIDTLSQTLGGGEENSTGMVTFVANATALANRFKCCVIAIHHSPLADDKRLRGHSSLYGGADAALLTERVDNDLSITLTLMKLKDEEDGFKLFVHLDRIVIGQDGDGESVSTLVISRVESGEAAPAAKGKPPRRVPEQRRLLMEIVTLALDEAGQDLFIPNGPTVRAVHDEIVRPRYYARIAERAGGLEDPDALAERQRKAFNRAVEGALKAKHLMAKAENDKRFMWLPST